MSNLVIHVIREFGECHFLVLASFAGKQKALGKFFANFTNINKLVHFMFKTYIVYVLNNLAYSH